MDLCEALLLLSAIAKDGAEEHKEEYSNGTVGKALKEVGILIRFLNEE